MNIGIIGSRSRDYQEDKDLIRKTLIKYADSEVKIISGGCKYGGDRFAEELAKEFSLEILIFPAKWDVHGKNAGFVRNHKIVEFSNLIIACWDKKSKGTKHTIKLAVSKKIPVIIV